MLVLLRSFHTIVVDGHDVEALCHAFHEATTVKGKPTCLVAKTFKGALLYIWNSDFTACLGKGFPNVEDQLDWHGKPLGKNSAAALEAVKKEIVNPGPHGIVPEMFVDDCPKVEFPVVKLSEPPKYEMGQKV